MDLWDKYVYGSSGSGVLSYKKQLLTFVATLAHCQYEANVRIGRSPHSNYMRLAGLPAQ